MNNNISFSVQKYSIEEINDSQLARLRLWIVKDGNNAHKMPISLDSIKNASFSLIGKPVVFKYSIKSKDFEGHMDDEIPCGVFMHDCNITYEKDEEDENLTWLVADCIIWKYYCPEVMEVFKRDGDKAISMEIQILETKDLEDGIIEITSFLFLAVTLLGTVYSPAIKNAKATVLQFSDLVKQTEQILNYIDFSIPKEIKEIAKNGLSSNTGNSVGITTAKYLINNNTISHQKLKSFSKYFCKHEENIDLYGGEPCRKWVSGLIDKINDIKGHQINNINSNMIIGNFSKKEVQNEMIFNKDEYATKFDMTANEIRDLLWAVLDNVKYQDGEYECVRYWLRDYDETYIYAFDYQDNKLVALPYSITDGTANIDFENAKKAKLAYIITEEDDDDSYAFAEKIMQKKMSAVVSEKEEMCNKYSTLEIEFNATKEQLGTSETEKTEVINKFSTLEKEHKTLSEENISLKEFKNNVEKQEFETKIEFAISEVSEDLKQEQIDEWREKSKEFSNPDDFSNAIQAFAYSLTKKDKTQSTRIPLPRQIVNEKASVWDRI